MPRAPIVTVITPAFNAEKTIVEAAQSILSQSWKNFEYLIIDDASTDQTWKELQKLAKKDTRIQIIKNPQRLGIAGTRNRGVNLAQGKYIAWQDADDISTPDRLSLQLKKLESNTQIGIVGGWLEFFDGNQKVSVRKYASDDKTVRGHIFRYSPVAQPVAMIRREVFEKVGLYDLRYPPAEDIDMSFRIGSYYSFANIPKVLLRYRVSPTSATYRQLRKIELVTLKVRIKNIFNPAYSLGLTDLVFNLVQFVVLFWLPPRSKIALFNFIRNTSK